MHKTPITGAALALFAAAMGASGSAAAYPIYPTKPCTAANYGDVTMVDTWRLPGGINQYIYQCEEDGARKTAGC
jgi:hypothetical protein